MIQRWFRRVGWRILLSPPLLHWYDRPENMTLGRRGEREAERFFLRRGSYILARNFSDHAGEIDLVVAEQDSLVMVEVKTRREAEPEFISDAVDASKQRRIASTARSFIKLHHLEDSPVRFDVIAIAWPESGDFQLRHYQAAFEDPLANQLL